MNERSIYKMRVRDVMSTDVVCVDASETIHEALELMVENRVSALPVVDRRGHCTGILSTTDLVDLAQHFDDQWTQLESADLISGWSVIERVGNSFGNELVISVMSEDIASVSRDVTLAEAASCMLRNRVHRLPVVDAANVLIGIVSTTDLLEAFASAKAKNSVAVG